TVRDVSCQGVRDRSLARLPGSGDGARDQHHWFEGSGCRDRPAGGGLENRARASSRTGAEPRMSNASGQHAPPFRGGLVVISGPSGSGKTTICQRLLDDQRVRMSVSATTRPQRPNEVEGRDYYFRTNQEFDRLIELGEFIEWAAVYGNRYGS